MGRNGSKPSVLSLLKRDINAHVGETIYQQQIAPPSASPRILIHYLTSFARLGYLRVIGGAVTKPDTRFEILRAIPEGYNNGDLEREIRELRGLIP